LAHTYQKQQDIIAWRTSGLTKKVYCQQQSTHSVLSFLKDIEMKDHDSSTEQVSHAHDKMFSAI
jgi:hypothetical protein